VPFADPKSTMRVLLNYASWEFRSSQRLNSRSGLKIGGFDHAWSFGPRNIDPAFFEQNREILSGSRRILSEARGSGYWLWKPYFILNCLKRLKEGDFLFYSDAGAKFIASMEPLFTLAESRGLDLIPFQLKGYKEKWWTKRDAFLLMNCDTEPFTESDQRLCGFVLLQKTDFTINFVTEWLRLARDPRLLTDAANTQGHHDYSGFRAHRHDQSIFSLLTKIHRLESFRDPSQFGNTDIVEFPNSPYGQLLDLTRKRFVPLPVKVWRKIQREWTSRS